MQGLTAASSWTDESSAVFQEIATEGADRARKIAVSIEVTAVTKIAATAHTLIEESRDAALLVVGTRGHGDTTSAPLGSVAFAVSSYAHCPVIVVRRDSVQPPDQDRPAAVGVDGSACSDIALRYAAETAARPSAAWPRQTPYR